MLPTREELIPNKGIISYDAAAQKRLTKSKLMLQIGEYYDVLCVVYGMKPLAILNGSKLGRENHAIYHDTVLTNEVIQLCYENDIWCIHNRSTRSPIYTKTVFFHKDNYNDAVNLMAVIFYDRATVRNYDYIIGKSLGYSLENIQAFYDHNNMGSLSKEEAVEFDKQIEELDVTLEQLNVEFPGELVLIKEISFI
jgi:hypothetical protein